MSTKMERRPQTSKELSCRTMDQNEDGGYMEVRNKNGDVDIEVVVFVSRVYGADECVY